MNVFIVILGICLLLVGIIVPIVSYHNSGKMKASGIYGLLICLGVVFFVFGFSYKIIPTGYSGVRTTFGQISQQTVKQGFNFKIPFVQSIHKVNNKMQDVTLKEKIWGETKEKTPVYAENIIITYQLSTKKTVWIYTNVTNTDDLLTSSIVSSALKSAMVEFEVNDVTNRSKIEPLAKEKLTKSLNEKYGEGTVIVHKVVINNMDFEDSYNEAIAAKSIAKQTQEKQLIENETAIAKAEADKKVAITNAEAKAESTRIAAEAEADANKKISESLTDGVLKNKFYDTWDGKLPEAMGSDTVITNISE